MITLPSTIETDLATTGQTKIAALWKLTRTDYQVFCYTGFDQDITFGGYTYKADTGFMRTALSSDSSLAVDSVDVEGVLDDDSITEADLLAGVWDHAKLELMIIDWEHQAEVKIMKTGWLGQVSASNIGFRAELLGLSSALQQNVTEVTSPTCRATLGDARCKKDLTAFTFEGEVTAVTDNRQFTTDLANADHYFVGGEFTWLTGANAGLKMEIRDSTAAGAVTLFLPMQRTVAAGDTFRAVRGCDKFLVTCRDVYDNVYNMRAEPYVKGTHFIFKGV